jgi:hypothetical protein
LTRESAEEGDDLSIFESSDSLKSIRRKIAYLHPTSFGPTAAGSHIPSNFVSYASHLPGRGCETPILADYRAEQHLDVL